MSAAPRERRGSASSTAPPSGPPPAPAAESAPPAAKEKKAPTAAGLPFLLDFFPLEGSDHTRLATFFERLRAGSLCTTRCTQCGAVHWPPRVACPECHSETLEWIALPKTGHLYAFSAVLVGAPVGMEKDVPFAVGLVDLDGSSLRLFGRIEGKPWTELHVGDPVGVEPFETPDGRAFYRFRAL